MVEHLLISTCEGLGSIPSVTNKTKQPTTKNLNKQKLPPQSDFLPLLIPQRLLWLRLTFSFQIYPHTFKCMHINIINNFYLHTGAMPHAYTALKFVYLNHGVPPPMLECYVLHSNNCKVII